MQTVENQSFEKLNKLNYFSLFTNRGIELHAGELQNDRHRGW